MNETKHTPGPRHAKQFDGGRMIVLGPERDGGRQDLIGTFTGERRVANATLDAAAPDLLAACRDHGLPMRAGSDTLNPYGTFPDALRNVASELPAIMSEWATWLRRKAGMLEVAIVKAEGSSDPKAEESSR